MLFPRCSNCDTRMQPGIMVYRANAKGELPAIWLCVPCGGRALSDPETIKLVETITARLRAGSGDE